MYQFAETSGSSDEQMEAVPLPIGMSKQGMAGCKIDKLRPGERIYAGGSSFYLEFLAGKLTSLDVSWQ